MRRLGIILLMVLAVGGTGCSRTKVIPVDEAHMTGSSFLQTAVKIKAGSPVKFIDPVGAAEHILVVGSNGQWQTDPNAPDKLNVATGMPIQPGQEIDVVFPNPGTYTITCTIHPSMLLTVTVT
jgi:plastocyanin